MEIKLRNKDGVTLCCLSGEININTIGGLNKVFGKLITEKTQKVVLNFSDVNYIDSTGIASIIKFAKAIGNAGGCMVLSDVIPKIGYVFKITKVDRLFRIFTAETEAVRNLNK
ncbi:MAG: STAS domain-containing protein [Candidatus Omnitrophota bacterium]|nr:STAS domain-containing protein [Candidatus Omnitrophota bacterium]